MSAAVAEDAVGAADWSRAISGLSSSSFARAFVSCSMICSMTLSRRSMIVVLGFAQGGLVGDLEEVAQGLGAFAEEAAHGQADLVHGV